MLCSPNVPHPTGCAVCTDPKQPLVANEVRVYVLRGRSSNRKFP
ncbi:hypothetical protein BJY54_003835 [Streptomyces nodosus]|nr:hypothetical protein [Streptomyces nodosus]